MDKKPKTSTSTSKQVKQKDEASSKATKKSSPAGDKRKVTGKKTGVSVRKVKKVVKKESLDKLGSEKVKSKATKTATISNEVVKVDGKVTKKVAVATKNDDKNVSFSINKKIIKVIIFGVIVLIGFFFVMLVVDAGFQWYENTQIVARINGKIITRKQLADDMIRMEGIAYIDDNLSLRILIAEKARDEGISVSKEEIEKLLFEVYEVDSVEALEKKINDLGFIDMQMFYDQAELQLNIEKLVGEIAVSEEEIDAEMQAYREMYKQEGMTDEEFDEVMTSVGGREIIIDRLMEQKKTESVEALLEEIDKSSTIENYLTVERDYEFFGLYKNLWEKWFRD